MTAQAYLTPSEAAEQLGVHPNTVRRRAQSGQLPALQVTARIVRLEARPVLGEDAAPAWPADAPDPVPIGWLAELWRVSLRTLYRLARRGELPLELRGGQWVGPRRRVLTWVIDHTHEELD